jgi:hypothetical protein
MTMIWSLRRLSNRYSFHVYLSDLSSINGQGLAKKFPDVEFRFLEQFVDDQILDNALFLNDLEFNTSLKSVALTDMLNRFDRKIFYCDSDLYFLAEPLAAIDALGCSGVLLTPHQVSVTSDESDFQMSRTGVFNAGFFGVSGGVGRSVAAWLTNKSRFYCLLEPEEGIFVDQKWLDLIPALFEDVKILRKSSYNIGYWNIKSRGFDDRAVFLHLSGFDLNSKLQPDEFLSKYSKIYLNAILLEKLRPYLDAYRNIRTDILFLTVAVKSSSIESNFERKMSVFMRRYSVKRQILRIKDGEILLCNRLAYKPFKYTRLYRTESRILKLTRFLGEYMCSIGLAGILDKAVDLFRILGRRNSWLR